MPAAGSALGTPGTAAAGAWIRAGVAGLAASGDVRRGLWPRVDAHTTGAPSKTRSLGQVHCSPASRPAERRPGAALPCLESGRLVREPDRLDPLVVAVRLRLVVRGRARGLPRLCRLRCVQPLGPCLVATTRPSLGPSRHPGLPARGHGHDRHRHRRHRGPARGQLAAALGDRGAAAADGPFLVAGAAGESTGSLTGSLTGSPTGSGPSRRAVSVGGTRARTRSRRRRPR